MLLLLAQNMTQIKGKVMDNNVNNQAFKRRLQNCCIETPRLMITCAQAEQYGLIIPHIPDVLSAQVTKSLPANFQNINDITKAEDWLAKMHHQCELLLVELASTKTLIGFVFLSASDEDVEEQGYQLGYVLAQAYWGQGIASELLGYFIRWCENHTSINKLIAGVEPSNKGSVAVLKKLQFSLDTEKSTENHYFFMRQV